MTKNPFDDVFDDQSPPEPTSAATLVWSADLAARYSWDAGLDYLEKFSGISREDAHAVLEKEAVLFGRSDAGFYCIYT